MISYQIILIFCIYLICDISSDTGTFCPPQELILPCRCSQKNDDIQIWCSHSDLPRVLHGIKSVAKTINRPVDELILENNQLPSLPGRFFSPLKVVRLMLRHNGVERLGNGWLNDLEQSLVEIYIVEQNLRSIAVDSLLGLRQLEAVTIQSESLKRIPLYSGLPRLRYIRIESSSLVDITTNAFSDLHELETVQISGSPRLNRLEAGVFNDLPKLRSLNVGRNGISWIHLRALSILPSLQKIDLSGNKISDAGIVGRALKDLKRLETLKLNDNHITILSEGSFVDMPSLKELLINDNAISEIQHGAFYRTPNLKFLHLENNFLSKVHPESFLQTSGSGVEYLHLDNNEIARVDEVRSLLSALPMLKFLDLSYNRLEEIPFGSLRGHGTLEQFYLNDNIIRRIERDAFLAMPALRELRLRNNSLHDSLPMPFWNLPGLKGLDLSSNKFQRIDPHLLMGLPSLRRLDIGDNTISTIDPSSFADTMFLETINISKNELTMIHPATFRKLDKLFEIDASYNNLHELIPGLPKVIERINLRRNKIQTLPQSPNKALDLPSLRMLDIGGNMIQRIPKSAFKSLTQLRYLSLAQNRLQTIDQASLIGLDRLEMLSLQDNRIMALHEKSMEPLTDLKSLNLQGNRLELFVDNTIANTKNLEHLDLSKNNIIEMSPNVFANSRKLNSLDISNNNLKDLPESMTGLSELKELDISFNRLTNLRSDMLSSLQNLEELRASNNKVPNLPHETFKALPMLQYLDLSSNELNQMEMGAVWNLPQLQELVLADNRLVELNDRVFEGLPNLQAVHLQQNNLRYLSPKCFVKTPSIVYLNLSSNNFENLEHVGFRSVRNLEVLDLSNNGIRRVTTNPLRGLDWLVELRLDNNRICKVQGEPFSSMPRLRVLTMRNNRLSTIAEPTFRNLRGNLAYLDLEGNTFDCSCEMVWLNAWYQETDSFAQYPGPKCRDGTLLREYRSSKKDCNPTDEQTNHIPLTNDHGDVFSRQINYGECDDEIQEEFTNNPRPSPVESEYFYDQYIDYPINDTHLAISNNSGPTNINSIESFPSNINISNTILNYNKHKQQQQQMQQHGSSQFTFFGVPLPNLNIGNLWSNGRSANTRSSIGTKGKGRVQVYRPEDMEIFKFLNRNDQLPATHRDISQADNQSENPKENDSFYRPIFKTPFVKPEIENGGFVPMLPGTGGFHPIANPEMNNTDNERSSIREMVTVTNQNDEPTWPQIQQEGTYVSSKNPELTENNSNNRRENTDYQKENVDDQKEIIDARNFNQSKDDDYEIMTEPEIIEQTTLSPLQNFLADINTKSNVDNLPSDSITPSLISSADSSIDRSELISSSSEYYIPTTTIKSIQNPFDQWSNFNQSPSSLSELVAPGAQVGQSYRPPPGRSTITKIFSTPIPIAEEYQRTTSISGNNSNYHDINSIGTIATTDNPQQTFTRKPNMDWYYANYNKSKIGDYDPSLNSLKSSAEINGPVLKIVILFTIMISIQML